MYVAFEEPPPRPSLAPTVLLVILTFLVLGILAFMLIERFGGPTLSGESRIVAPRGDLADWEKTTIAIFEREAPSVVSITNTGLVRKRTFWGGDSTTEVRQGTGSGFVWDEAGHIVTNFHVVDGGTRFTVNFPGIGESYDAQFIGGTENYDLSVLLVDAPRRVLRPITIGSSEDLKVGQAVLAIGQPFGLQQTLSTGVVSALGRQIRAGVDAATKRPRVIRNVVQTDAAINPGNSGGPLLDSAGRLIGVNTAIYSEVGQNSGIGFAIPVDTVNWVVPELISKGNIERPTLGVRLAETDDPIAWGQAQSGAYVLEAVPDGPAAKAGIRGAVTVDDTVQQDGDIITYVGRERVRNATDLIMALERYKEGDRVMVRFLRGGQPFEVETALASPSNW